MDLLELSNLQVAAYMPEVALATHVHRIFSSSVVHVLLGVDSFCKLVLSQPVLASFHELGNYLCRLVHVRVRKVKNLLEQVGLRVLLRKALPQLLVLVIKLDLLATVLLNLTLIADPARLVLNDLLQHEFDQEDGMQSQECQQVHDMVIVGHVLGELV